MQVNPLHFFHLNSHPRTYVSVCPCVGCKTSLHILPSSYRTCASKYCITVYSMLRIFYYYIYSLNILSFRHPDRCGLLAWEPVCPYRHPLADVGWHLGWKPFLVLGWKPILCLKVASILRRLLSKLGYLFRSFLLHVGSLLQSRFRREHRCLS